MTEKIDGPNAKIDALAKSVAENKTTQAIQSPIEEKHKLRSRDKSTSYAQVLAAKANNSANVRNIFLAEENDETAAKMMKEITADKEIIKCGRIEEITMKSSRLLTV